MEAIVGVSEKKNAVQGEAKNGEHEEHAAVNVGGESEKTAITTARGEAKNGEHVALIIKDYQRKENQIQVSNTKKPFIFYLNLAKKYINQFNGVELCALGMAIPTVVIISENLKRNGLAIEKHIMISTVTSKQDKKGRVFQKAKIEILLLKAGKMEQETVAAPLKKDVDSIA